MPGNSKKVQGKGSRSEGEGVGRGEGGRKRFIKGKKLDLGPWEPEKGLNFRQGKGQWSSRLPPIESIAQNCLDYCFQVLEILRSNPGQEIVVLLTCCIRFLMQQFARLDW